MTNTTKKTNTVWVHLYEVHRVVRYADDTTLMAESEDELKIKSLLMKGEWKSWLKAQYSEN